MLVFFKDKRRMAMVNSMDTIQVRYSGSDKPISIQKFMAIDPEELNDRERKIQEAVILVYQRNGKKPPLYKSFSNPDVEKRSLVINCTGHAHSIGTAFFSPKKNEVCFINKFGNLTGTLAHELTHAEQHLQKEIRKIKEGRDNKAKKENWLIDEAEAFYKEARVCSELGISEDVDYLELYQQIEQEYTNQKGHKDAQKIKQKVMERTFNGVSHVRTYRIQAEIQFPVLDSDKGIENIPEYYGLTHDFLEILNAIPREAQTDAGKIHQCFANHRETQIPALNIPRKNRPQALKDLFDYCSDKQELDYLMHLKDKDGELYFDKRAILTLISNAIKEGKEYFNNVVEYFQDEQKRLPFVENDFIVTSFFEKTENSLLYKLTLDTDAGRNDIIQMLPEILKLKGSDGQPLVGKNHLAQKLTSSITQMKDPKNLQRLFDIIKDDKGNLPFSREVFNVSNSKDATENGSNQLLNNLYSLYQRDRKMMKFMEKFHIDTTGSQFGEVADSLASEEYYLGAIPILMSLKDKEGQPIISQDDIANFPQDNPLAPAIKAYAKPIRKTKLREFMATQQKPKLSNPPSRRVSNGRNAPRS